MEGPHLLPLALLAAGPQRMHGLGCLQGQEHAWDGVGRPPRWGPGRSAARAPAHAWPACIAHALTGMQQPRPVDVCRYEQGLREGKFSVEEMRRKAARESLERYTHYYERYHAHDVSRKEAARLLSESVSDHLRRVSITTQIAESQLKFITEVRPAPLSSLHHVPEATVHAALRRCIPHALCGL